MQNVAHILKGVLINYLVIEGGFPSEILSIYGNIRCFFEILKMLICNFLADPAQCAYCTFSLNDLLIMKKYAVLRKNAVIKYGKFSVFNSQLF